MGGGGMFTRLIKVEKIHLNTADYEIKYFQNTNLEGNNTFTSEVNIGLNEKIILDDHSMASLKYKVNLIVPVALQSRSGSQRLRG
jgi:hypothetical protein